MQANRSRKRQVSGPFRLWPDKTGNKPLDQIAREIRDGQACPECLGLMQPSLSAVTGWPCTHEFHGR